MIDLTMTNEQWVFLFWLCFIWLVLSFAMLILYCVIQDRRDNYETPFTVKDIFVGILFLPFTLLFGLIFVIMWFIFRVCHLEDFLDKLSEFMNKPIGKRKN